MCDYLTIKMLPIEKGDLLSMDQKDDDFLFWSKPMVTVLGLKNHTYP